MDRAKKMSAERSYGDLSYDQEEKSALLWALGVGTFIGVWPFNFLYLHYGARLVFFGAGLLSALSTVVIPIAAYMGLGWFIAARIVQSQLSHEYMRFTLWKRSLQKKKLQIRMRRKN
uniref:DUF4133 domain-containing protein n=1 Tax=Gongylonema pulchrum TaxID=637853 RepID=A0A183EWH6_9BILA